MAAEATLKMSKFLKESMSLWRSPKGEALPTHAIHLGSLEILRGTYPSPEGYSSENISTDFASSH